MADQQVPTFDDLASELSAEADENLDEVVLGDPEPAPSTGEPKNPEVTDPKPADKPADEPATPAQGDEPADEHADPADPANPPADDQPLTRGEERKQGLQTEIRDLVSERNDLLSQRNALQQEVQGLTQQAYGPQSIDQIMAETGQDEMNARVTAMEQSQAFKDYNQQATDAQLLLGHESQRVIQDFPIFNPVQPDGTPNPDYQPQLAIQAAQILEANVIRDPNVPEVVAGPDGRQYTTGKGMIVGYRATPYQIYKPIADAHAMSVQVAQQSNNQGRIEGQRAAEKMLASADPASSTTPAEPKEDPFFSGLTKNLNLPTK